MTVKELIEQLQQYDENKRVEILCTYDCGHAAAGGSMIQIIDNGAYLKLYNDEC